MTARRGEESSHRERAELAELEHLLTRMDIAADAPEVMEMLQRILGGDLVARFRFGRDRSRPVIERHVTSNAYVSREYFRALRQGVASGELAFLFTLRAPEVAQRNRPIEVAGARSVLDYSNRELSRLGRTVIDPSLHRLVALHDRFGIADHHQLRAVICDGALALDYVAVLQPHPFTKRQHRMFARALRALHRRRLVDHRFEEAGHARSTIDALLEAVGRAAYIVDTAGRIVHLNALAATVLESSSELPCDPAKLFCSGRYDVIPIETRGVPQTYLVIGRRPRMADLAAALAQELALGSRAAQVLLHVADGASTKTIAARLGIATNTVEYHLTRVFARIGVSSRTELQSLLLDRWSHGTGDFPNWRALKLVRSNKCG